MNGFFLKARPVWAANREYEMNLALVFKTVLPKAEKALLKLTGSSYYNIYVNNEFVALGPARAAHDYYRVDSIPISLNNECNEVKVIVFGYNVNSFYHLDQPSFLQAEIETDNEVVAYTDAAGSFFSASEWLSKLKRVQRYSFQRPFVEVYDFTKEQFVDVPLKETDDKNLLPRNIFYGDYEKEQPKAIIQKGQFEVSDKEHYYNDRSIRDIGAQLKGFKRDELEILSTAEAQKITPITKEICNIDFGFQKMDKNSYITYDMGRNLTGLVGFDIELKEDGEIVLVFDEIMQNDEINFVRLTSASVIIIKAEKGRLRFLSAEPYTYRYIRIYVKNSGFEISDFYLRRVCSPKVHKKLATNNCKLIEIFDAAVETYRQNTFDVYMDCPSRERAGWLCDSFFTSRVEFALTGKSEIEKNFLENYILPDSFKCIPEGMLPMCYPADHYDGVFIPNWAMWFIVELKEYFLRTGDEVLLDKAKSRVYSLLNYFKPFENEYGLLENLESWVFIEWSKSNELVQDVSFPTNMLYSKIKIIAGELYDDISLVKSGEQLKDVIKEMSYTEKGFFCDNAYRNGDKLELSGEYTESCQYYAFHTGVAEPNEFPELWNRLINDFGVDRKQTGKWPEIHFANAFIGNYLRLDLICVYGNKDELLKNIEGYFYYMAEKTGTLWENVSDNASCNHGFASHVLYWFDKLGMLIDE